METEGIADGAGIDVYHTTPLKPVLGFIRGTNISGGDAQTWVFRLVEGLESTNG